MKLFSDAAKAALESGRTVVHGAVEIAQTDGSTFAGWGGDGVLTIGDTEFVGLGDAALAQVSAGALGDAAQNVSLSLSGVQPDVAARVQLGLLRRAATVVRRLIWDGSGTQLLDQHVFSRGRIDTASAEETPGGTATITAEVESAAKSLGRAGGRMRTDADQRLIDPMDVGFGKVSYAGQVQLFWGGKPPASASAVANGGVTNVVGAGGGLGITGNVLQPD